MLLTDSTASAAWALERAGVVLWPTPWVCRATRAHSARIVPTVLSPCAGLREFLAASWHSVLWERSPGCAEPARMREVGAAQGCAHVSMQEMHSVAVPWHGCRWTPLVPAALPHPSQPPRPGVSTGPLLPATRQPHAVIPLPSSACPYQRDAPSPPASQTPPVLAQLGDSGAWSSILTALGEGQQRGVRRRAACGTCAALAQLGAH